MPDKPTTKYLRDYQPPAFKIKSVDLHFDLHEEFTIVKASLEIQRQSTGDLVLDGRNLELVAVSTNGKKLSEADYELSTEQLTVKNPPTEFTLSCTTKIFPQDNTSLEGLYRSNGIFCTQCEAEGFRKITYFPDRPDVMASFTTTITADKKRYPVLLSNGNLVEHGDMDDNRHFAKWHDPFPKPCYIFALVAGDLAVLKDKFITRSGRQVELRIYTEHHNADKCDHAMRSLQKAMRWDEERFSLEYDLDLYMILAVDDFNAGAMENKGLNIFNSKYVLAQPQTATDQDYEGIESVIGHEYFHNWTGDRVTCRDWFQLSLKEGLTVFRDQEFTADTSSRAIKRINDVNMLRNHQFLEDAGPMAHPVRPESYIEINNFYTLTVYEKGAEVIRMLHTILGEDIFQRGMQIYIKRHDGEAVTTEDFVQAMEDAWCESGAAKPGALTQFKLWYNQAGTPTLQVSSDYDEQTKTYKLVIEQEAPKIAVRQPSHAKDASEKCLHIPVKFALLGAEGDTAESGVLHIKSSKEEFTFNTPSRPVPSLLREFSAPVHLQYNYSDDDLAFLLLHDQDPFNRWEAGQRLLTNKMLEMITACQTGNERMDLGDSLPKLFGAVLEPGFHDDAAFISQIMTLPSEEYLAEKMAAIDVGAIHQVREFVRRQFGILLADSMRRIYQNYKEAPYIYDPKMSGKRRLRNICLAYLMAAGTDEAKNLCLSQFERADNMTDELSALTILAHSGCPESKAAIASFYEKWQHETLVMDKWFALQATAPLPETLAKVQELMQHPQFNIKNPNKVRALIGSFAAGNPTCFHDDTGAGYTLFADIVLELNIINPAIAARLLNRLSRWKRYVQPQQNLMQDQLKRIINKPDLSKGVYEVASKSLENI
jgi:aminopeptidase N